MMRLAAVELVLALLLVAPAPVLARDCRPEPASQWAPAGWVCEPRFGVGTASTYAGPHAATNWCTWPWTDCRPVAVTSLDTGIRIVVTPAMWCHCYVRAPGPNGERERLIDLAPSHVAALGLPGPSLYDVLVEPYRGELGPVLPDTAVPS